MRRRTRSAATLPWTWGSVEGAEVPDGLVDDAPRRRAARSVASDADPRVLYLWLCQLRRAPYSYDWIDNVGRRSPRRADPTLTALAVGQRFMTIFSLVDVVPDRSLTLTMRPGAPTWIFGAITVRYAIVPRGDGDALLRGDLWMPAGGGPAARLRRYLLAWGDLLMMSKQLRTLRALAERDSSAPAPPAARP
ncbi:hypothetical protein [Brachybacterium sp. YJGR34]|uniref:hypothetical protein n=1 Tax=Brachybacterium sp. YJGR34 TaxID=2059911 RepID=UPI000E0A01AD|nr:hypothetical protein [Brachybacterium sp. YJGR34]